MAVSFTSEAAAREGEPKQPPPELTTWGAIGGEVWWSDRSGWWVGDQRGAVRSETSPATAKWAWAS
jgi:hypothetical protein